MQIQGYSTAIAAGSSTSTGGSNASAASSRAQAATLVDRTTISQAARDVLAANSDTTTASGGGTSAIFETNKGPISLDIDAYFAPAANTSGAVFTLPPLLLPNQKNIDALTSHISKTMPQFLAQNNIPSAPSKITYNNEEEIQLPPEYPYSAEFKQALKENPAMARELSTVNALTSHVVEMKKSIPFHQEYSETTTKAEADAVIQKYSHLFWGNRHNDSIALLFSASGELSLTANDKPVSS